MYKIVVNIKFKLVSKGEGETKKIAERVVKEFILGKNRCLVFLKGELGSGKTTFVRFALESLGIGEDKFKGSPTFTIVNEYENNIYHIDLYRIKSMDELIESGIYDYFEREGIFFVEWPEILHDKPDLLLEFKELGDSVREIYVYSS